jgi:hypothetical protein
MFESHKEYAGHLARQRATTGLQFSIKIRQTSTDTTLKVENSQMRRPVLVLLRNLRVGLLLWMRIQIRSYLYLLT